MGNQELTQIKVDGMTCTNCANSVRKRLERSGMEQVNVDFASGEVTFVNAPEIEYEEIVTQIDELGYKVLSEKPEKKNS